MKLTRATVLNAPAERVWAEVRRPRLLEYVAWPVQRFVPVAPPRWPEVWGPGQYQVRLWTFGCLPFGLHKIVFVYPPSEARCYRMLDDGAGKLIRQWRHLITIKTLGGDRCRYTDVVDIRAGLLTPFVYLFAVLFYRHRQRRWRKLVDAGFHYTEGWR